MILYHYTSIATLLNILENIKEGKICLRATHAKFFNDPFEYDYCLSLLKNSMRLFEKKKNIEKKISKGFHEMLFKDAVEITGSPYILSFSENQDDLSMWRSYGNDGAGVAIGFEKEKLIEYVKSQDSYNTELIKCLYSKNKINEELFKNWENNYSQMKFNDKSIGFTNFNFIINLITFSFKFKRKEYHLENEWRLCKNEYDYELVKFRESEGLIIPYINHLLPKEIIKEIIIGPCSERQLTRDSIAIFLRMKSLSNIELIQSKMPYRKV